MKVVIGIDQSYTDTGISIVAGGEVVHATNIKNTGKLKSEYRYVLKSKLQRYIKLAAIKYGLSNISIIVERVRLFSTRGNNEKTFISMAYIVSSASLIAAICDVAHDYGLEVYSVDTGSWKANVIGSKRSAGDKKRTAIDHVCAMGLKCMIRYRVERGKNKGKVRYNDNIADAICIGLYGFIDEKKQKLKLENA